MRKTEKSGSSNRSALSKFMDVNIRAEKNSVWLLLKSKMWDGGKGAGLLLFITSLVEIHDSLNNLLDGITD